MITLKMKLIILLLCMGASCQTTTCKSLREGKFKVTTKETGTTIITRKNNLQIEENADMKVNIVFNIRWTSDCSYELSPKQVIQGDSSILQQGRVVKVQIIGFRNNKYLAHSTSNFSDKTVDFEVEVLTKAD